MISMSTLKADDFITWDHTSALTVTYRVASVAMQGDVVSVTLETLGGFKLTLYRLPESTRLAKAVDIREFWQYRERYHKLMG